MAVDISQLSDNFSAGTLNTALWNNSSGSPNVVLDTALDRVQIACTAAYPAFGGFGPWNLTGGAIFARISPPPVGAGSTQMIMRAYLDANNRASLYFDGGGVLTASVINAGVTTTTVIGAYNPHLHSWWRIREAGGSLFFETAPDGYTWTVRATLAHSWSTAAVSVVWIAGFYGSEAAGLVGYVDHVNTLASPPDQLNLNFPVIDDGWGPLWGVNGGAFPANRFVDINDRTRGAVTVDRGRQYETDQVRSGESGMSLANTDAALDPLNASGPWYGRVLPYEPYRRRAQWPPTRNLLDQVQATAGDLGGVSLGPISSATSDVFSSTDAGGGSFVASAAAWQGATVMQFAVPSGTVATTRICHTPRPAVRPGQTYTVTLRVRNVTAATSLTVYAMLSWYTSAGGLLPSSHTFGSTVVLTGSASAAWTTVTVSGVPPFGAVGMGCGVGVAATAAAACSVQVDGWQAEKGAASTTWQCPGTWYPVFAGFIERWPAKWDLDGTYGMVTPNSVDAFSLLSQKTLSDPLTQEINGAGVRFLYKLDDPAGSTSAADWAGAYPPAPLATSKYGAGSFVFGGALTSTDPTGTFVGSGGTVATLNNPFPGQAVVAAATFLKLSGAGIKGPANPAVFVRAIAFRYTGPLPTNSAYLWSSMDGQRTGSNQSGSRVHALLGTDGKPSMTLAGPNGAATGYPAGGATNCADGNWHLLIFGYNQATGQALVSQDGNLVAFYGSIPATATPTGLISDCIGAYVDATVGNGTTSNFKGDVAFVAEFSSWFTGSMITNLYQAWKAACAGESTSARYARILRYAGYTGTTSIQTGLTTSMGVANFEDSDAVTALQAVVDTEGGAHYVAADGTVVFRARSQRYNATTPAWIFGERQDLGEFPYTDCTTDFDTTRLSNQAIVTQAGTGQEFYAQDAASAAAYFSRTMTRTINSTSTDECQDGANYLLSRYRQPVTRVSSIKLNPSTNPALWPVCLSLELGTRARIMRRPPGVPATLIEVFIEHIEWDFGDDNDVWCTLQCSPADLTPYGVFAAWHTTLATSPASGVSSITLNAGQDNTNVLAAQLAPGQQLVLGQGTTNQETVTVLSVGATSPGWTTGTVTLTAVTTKSHTALDVVCEPLPVGTTDSTRWDAVSKFDSIAFAY
ncbi:hypothetical protein JHN59_08590 [Streptomyces sp. MBT49]|uniref:hypothetical protein n=1 Tax=unclassified Streptomyces TaxID=2593676 RepID=UPI00190A43F2|nr:MULTISPECIES: hypothetical protein [unclassified Streptomyces]MBK3624904.1 hypothetical protein [Streptomyces sp. MBT49]MBK3632548.1 hypothetical protein [Streptomyces sp. MBT97]